MAEILMELISTEFKKLLKHRLLSKYMRRYISRQLISRDQRLFNGRFWLQRRSNGICKASKTLGTELLMWIVNETQLLVLLTDAKEYPQKFGVHPKHQQWLNNIIQLLLKNLK